MNEQEFLLDLLKRLGVRPLVDQIADLIVENEVRLYGDDDAPLDEEDKNTVVNNLRSDLF